MLEGATEGDSVCRRLSRTSTAKAIVSHRVSLRSARYRVYYRMPGPRRNPDGNVPSCVSTFPRLIVRPFLSQQR